MTDLIGQKIKAALFKNGARAEVDVSEARKILGLRLNVRKLEYLEVERELEAAKLIARVPGGRKIRDPSVRLFP